MSDAAATSPGKQLCDAQGDNCRKCSDSECNNEVATWTSSLRCYKCDSATGDSCHFDQSQSLSSRCEYDLQIGADDHCFSYFDGERALRGCIHDAPADIQAKCAAGSDECRLCETVDCNAEEIETNGQCYYCDGTVDANCETLFGHNPVYCPVGDRTGCFRSQIGELWWEVPLGILIIPEFTTYRWHRGPGLPDPLGGGRALNLHATGYAVQNLHGRQL